MNIIAVRIFMIVCRHFYIFNHVLFSMSVNQGNVHHAMLFVGVESHKKSNSHPVVLDCKFHTEGISKSTDVDLRRHAFAENHREHKPLRFQIRSAYGAKNSSPLLRGRLSGMYVYVACVRLH